MDFGAILFNSAKFLVALVLGIIILLFVAYLLVAVSLRAFYTTKNSVTKEKNHKKGGKNLYDKIKHG